MLAMSINMLHKRCVVIGGGSVAERRIKTLLQAQAKVEIISPRVTDTIRTWSEEQLLTWHQQAYVPGCIGVASFVFIATNEHSVNEQAAKEARSQGDLVNRADEHRDCDFTMPSVVTLGDLHMTISTGRSSPRMNALIRCDLEQRYQQVASILPVLNTYRQEVKQLLLTASERESFWRAQLGPREFNEILAGNWQQVEETLNHAINGIRTKS